MYQLCCELRKLKKELNFSIGMDHFSNISNRVKDAKEKMYKAQYVLHTAHGDLTLCMRERAVVHTILLLSGSKRVFSSRKQGYNDLAWGTRILATFINQ
jgi:hypothetical protein